MTEKSETDPQLFVRSYELPEYLGRDARAWYGHNDYCRLSLYRLIVLCGKTGTSERCACGRSQLPEGTGPPYRAPRRYLALDRYRQSSTDVNSRARMPLKAASAVITPPTITYLCSCAA